MPVREEEFRALKENILTMASLTRTAIRESIRSLVERDSGAARAVIEGDRRINTYDVRIDEECIRLLALTQPMGKDLRFITTTMNVVSNLERIADNAVNIAERALELNDEPVLKPYIDIPKMSEIAQGMVDDAITAFINGDRLLALDVLKRDDEMDDLNEAVFVELIAIMGRNPETISRGVKVSYVSKYLERIGDHATNIAETVIYNIEGRIIRHLLPEEIEKFMK